MSKRKRKNIEYKDPEARDRITANLKRGKKLELRKKINKSKKLTLSDSDRVYRRKRASKIVGVDPDTFLKQSKRKV